MSILTEHERHLVRNGIKSFRIDFTLETEMSLVPKFRSWSFRRQRERFRPFELLQEWIEQRGAIASDATIRPLVPHQR